MPPFKEIYGDDHKVALSNYQTYFAVPRKILQRLLREIPGKLIWYPMWRIEYKSKRKKYDFLFEAFLARKIKKKDIYVICLRNPKDLEFSDTMPMKGLIIEPIVSPEDIIDELINFRSELSDMIDELYQDVSAVQKRLVIDSLLFLSQPSSLAEADAMTYLYNTLLYAVEILDRIGIKKNLKVNIIESNLVYYPIYISEDFSQVFEPALKDEESKSLTELFRDADVKKALSEKILSTTFR